ncbi:hypothetical protein EON83_30095 [bacterium]|nr:MAG: hypothetical protein EON83_30095 [bacterium]
MKHQGRNLVGAILIAMTAWGANAQTAHLQFEGTYSWGYSFLVDEIYTPENSSLYGVTQYPTMSGATDTATIVFDMGLLGSWNSVVFSTENLGAPLALGLYEGAMDWPSYTWGHPGFDLNYHNVDNNSMYGSFDITQLSYFVDGKVETFAATFEVLVGPSHNAATYKGIFTYSATVPELSSTLMMFIGTCALATLVSRRRFRQ